MNMAVRIGIAPLLALCVLALAAAPAAAAPDTVPSDNSGAAQYTESLPGAEGGQTSKNLREKKQGKQKQGKATQEGALSKQDIKRLKALGKEGADAAELAAAAAKLAGAGSGAAGSQEGGASADEDGSSGTEQALRAATGTSDDGIDLLLVALIALAVLAALALVVTRRRGRAAPHDPGG